MYYCIYSVSGNSHGNRFIFFKKFRGGCSHRSQMEALQCQACLSKNKKGAHKKDKFITSGNLNVDYPICRRCHSKLKREPKVSISAFTAVTHAKPVFAAAVLTRSSRIISPAAAVTPTVCDVAATPSVTPHVFRHALLTSPTAPRTRASAAAVIHAAIANKRNTCSGI